MTDTQIALTLVILACIGTLLFGTPTVMWDYRPDATDVTHFNVYATTNLSQPFELVEQVPYEVGKTAYASKAWTDRPQSFYKVSAVGTNGLEAFAR